MGEERGGEGMGLVLERFVEVLDLVTGWSLAGDEVVDEDLEESWSLFDEEVLCWSVQNWVVEIPLLSLAAPLPLSPKRSLSGTSLGVLGSGSVSGEAPRRRPLILVEVTILFLSLGFRPRLAGVGCTGSVDAGGDKKSLSSSSDEA